MDATVMFTGNLVRDPELKKTDASQVASFTVAVTTSTKDADGKYASNFYDCSYWGKPADYLMAHAQKGTQVNVVGELKLEEFENKEGVKKNRLRVKATKIDLLKRLKENSSDAEDDFA